MKKYLFIPVLVTQLVSCGEAVKKDQSYLKIPDEGFSFQIPQRTGIQIPGNGKKVEALINDITGGQTLLTLKADSTTFFSSAIHEGDTLKFKYTNSSYKITCIDLVNNLIGEDVGSFKVFR